MDELTTSMENHCIVVYSTSYLRTGDFEGFIMKIWSCQSKPMIFFSGTHIFTQWLFFHKSKFSWKNEDNFIGKGL